jgi:SecD/SecF fusion protein
VYPVLGATFSEVKKLSLAFGLDLVGGMSVTMEISYPDLIRSHVKNQKDLKFRKPFDAAMASYNRNGGDFLDIFIASYQKINKGLPLNYIIKADGLGIKSSDSDIESYFRKLIASSMDGVEQIISRRINQFGVAQPNIQRDLSTNRLYIELPGVQDENTVAQKIQSTANLEFFETYMPDQLQIQWQDASRLSTQKEVEEVAEVVNDTLAKDTTMADSKPDAGLSLKNMNNKTKSLADLVKPVGGFAMGYTELADKVKVDQILRRRDVQRAFPEDVQFMWSAEPENVDDK